MGEIKSNENQNEEHGSSNTWGKRIKSSLLVAAVLSTIWVVVVIAAGRYNPSSASGLSSILGTVFGIFVVLSIITFILKSVWYFLRRNKE